MSSNNATVLPVSSGSMYIICNSSYMAGKWSNYGYVAVIQVHDTEKYIAHGHAGEIRNIPGVQSVVFKSPKFFQSAKGYFKWWDEAHDFILSYDV